MCSPAGPESDLARRMRTTSSCEDRSTKFEEANKIQRGKSTRHDPTLMADRAHIVDCILPALPQDVRDILESQLLGPQVCARSQSKANFCLCDPRHSRCAVLFSAGTQRL